MKKYIGKEKRCGRLKKKKQEYFNITKPKSI